MKIIKRGYTKSPILFDDGIIIAINKLSGFLSHPNLGSSKSKPCAFVGHYNSDDRRFDTSEGPLWLIHRLDQDTSGVLLAVHDKKLVAPIRKLFDYGTIVKRYSALVVGVPKESEGTWKDCIVMQKFVDKTRSKVVSGKTNASLSYTVEDVFPSMNLSLLTIELHSGKTHQIRTQCAHHKIPIAGDEVYGKFSVNRVLRLQIGLRRLFLHATEVVFLHPKTGKTLRITAPLPPDLCKILTRCTEIG